MVIKKIMADGNCPFCPENFLKYHRNPILNEEGSWLITRNYWPYPNTRDHFILVAKRHIEKITEMTAEDWVDINKLLHWATGEFNITGGALAMRFGDSKYTGASVRHLHGQFIVPDIGNIKKNNVTRPISEEEFDAHPDAVWFRIG